MTTAIISQARMTSTRLPGKVLMEVANKSLLAWHITRLQAVLEADTLVLAITDNNADNPLEALADQLAVSLFRGSEHNVLNRYYLAAKKAQAKVIVRVTSDCPLIDSKVVSDCIQLQAETQADYVSNVRQRSFPRGLDVEVFTFHALQQAEEKATTNHEREHVTPFIRNHPDLFSQADLVYKLPDETAAFSTPELIDMRWTVDTPEDFQFIEKLLLSCQNEPLCTWQTLLKRLSENPEWLALNAHIQQKTE